MSTAPEIIESLRSEFIQEATSAPKVFKDLAKVEHYIAESYKTRLFIVWPFTFFFINNDLNEKKNA